MASYGHAHCSLPGILDGLIDLLVGEFHRGHEIDRGLNHVGTLVNQVTTLFGGLSMLVPVLERLRLVLMQQLFAERLHVSNMNHAKFRHDITQFD